MANKVNIGVEVQTTTTVTRKNRLVLDEEKIITLLHANGINIGFDANFDFDSRDEQITVTWETEEIVSSEQETL